MNRTNELVICKDEYESSLEFECAIRRAIMLLLENNYIATIRYDEKGLGIVVIEYNHADRALGAHYPYWLSTEEYESVVWDEDRKDDE